MSNITLLLIVTGTIIIAWMMYAEHKKTPLDESKPPPLPVQKSLAKDKPKSKPFRTRKKPKNIMASDPTHDPFEGN